jgi:[methyl-Co(III) methanol-specific corrinoid protein]:coenzyme M methyltransferase
MNSRERVLKLFRKEKTDYIPAFSGYGNITIHGLEKYNLKFADIHTDARKMADMAASTYQLFGFECAVVPFDMGVEAEALGSKVNYYPNQKDILYPTIIQHAAEKVVDLHLKVPEDLSKAGRIPVVVEAIKILKKEVGNDVAIGAWVLGPYTLAGQLVDLSDLGKSAIKKQDLLNGILAQLTDVLIKIIEIYRSAGADYITVREMGAGPDILSPNVFNKLIRPHLERLIASIESPKVLHMCGSTNEIIEELIACKADAISVEGKNDIPRTRKLAGPDALIFGDVDSFGALSQGTVDTVKAAVKSAVDKGVSAIWPGCDIWPVVPKENMVALMEAAREYGKLS